MSYAIQLLGAALLLWLTGCTPTPTPLSSPTPDPVATLLHQAEQARRADQREHEALALRQAVELLGLTVPPDDPVLQSARAQCVTAMLEAGGNAASYRLWSDIAKNNGPSQESRRMKERARQMLLLQATELQQQVGLDHQAGRHQAALCTALASQQLLQLAGAPKAALDTAQKAVEQAENRLTARPAPQPDESSASSG